tara:strand:+ start:21210 stop:22949 length:1740 start_codon:yes stop_codon:yes gene_type:complete
MEEEVIVPEEPKKTNWFLIIVISAIVILIIVVILIFFFTLNKTPKITEEELLEGKEIQLNEGQKAIVMIDDKEYSLNVVSAISSTATATLTDSEGNQVSSGTINVGEEMNIDVDSDGSYDLQIKLEKIEDDKPYFNIKKIITTESSDSQTPQPGSDSGDTCIEQGGIVCGQTQQCTIGDREIEGQLCCFHKCFDVQSDTCDSLGGQICSQPGLCNGTSTAVSDTAYCCFGACGTQAPQKTCLELGGQFCDQNLCDGNKIPSSDGPSLGKECCLGFCSYPPSDKTCGELGGNFCMPGLCDGNVINSYDAWYQLSKCCIGTCAPEQGREACTSNSDCEDNDPCTVDVCGLGGISGCGYNQITTCKSFSDGCCPTGCDSTTDGDCQAPTQSCSDGTPEDTCVYERTGQESDKPKYCYSNLILQDNCNYCGCPSGKQCAVNLKCLTPTPGGSYLYTESDFTSVGIDLVANPLTQEITESFNDNYVFDVYKSHIQDKFTISVVNGVYVPGTIQSQRTTYIALGWTILSEDEYGDDSIRVSFINPDEVELRFLTVEKDDWAIEITYVQEDETKINSLATIGLGRI